ncbi:MAG: nucleoside recognition domain-containing protein [Tenuifilaceae bacterium]
MEINKNSESKLVSNKRKLIYKRLQSCVKSAMPSAIKTSLWFLKITIPISLTVTLLSYFGVLTIISQYLSPVFNLIGLPGEAALVYITSAFLNVYSAIAVITSIDFTIREMTILAIMSLIAHNLILETAVQKKTGSKVWHIILIRVGTSIVAAILLNTFLPAQMGLLKLEMQTTSTPLLLDVLSSWGLSALKLSLKIVVLITLLMILQKILLEFKITDILSSIFKPFLKVMGLPESTSFMWLVANLLGLAYGSAVMIDEVQSGRLSKEDADLLNYHIAISHSNLEDLILFAAIGISVWWLLLPRIVFAMIAVWGRRLFLYYFK